MSQDMQASIRVQAKELLSLGEVGCVVGYEQSPRGSVRPAFVYDEEGTDRLVWSDACHHNLVVYLREMVLPTRREASSPRVAIVAKPCDVRALNVLVHEGQVAREQVFIIGVACSGMQLGGKMQEHCERCRERVPLFYDALVGEPPTPRAEDDTWEDVCGLEDMSPADRLAFWTREFDRCIRCYACRQACPACYCSECLIEQLEPHWVSIAHRVPEKAFFHVMRAYHLAGRCVECHACDSACPMHIPLSLLNRKLAKDVEMLFGYVAGSDAETPPPLATFHRDEQLPL
jgi:ferredoxin